LEYLVSTELFRQRLDSWVLSVTRSHQRASPDLIYRFWSAWPDPAEQRSIAAFLDRETGRIDRLAAKKRELIERLASGCGPHPTLRLACSRGNSQPRSIAKLGLARKRLPSSVSVHEWRQTGELRAAVS
jgi:hypothetical protein